MSPVHRTPALDTAGARPLRTGAAGYGLVEVMLALAIGAAVIAGSLHVSAAARGDAKTERLVQDVSALTRDIRSAWGGPHGAGYAGLTPRAINARSDAMASNFVDEGAAGRFQLHEVRIQLASSSFALDAAGNPLNTGRDGDSFLVQIDGLAPSACSRVVTAAAHDATAASVRAGSTDTAVGVRANLDPSALANACGGAKSAQVTLHFN